jgi:KUP system potassium uptake protein
MGHFGRIPVRIAWYGLVFPSLMLNYFGRALWCCVTRKPRKILSICCARAIAPADGHPCHVRDDHRFTGDYLGCLFGTQQASRLNFLPRLRVLHTRTLRSQIYVPLVNWLMLLGVVSLMLGFGTSSALAGAYGIAVNGVMIISSLLLMIVLIGRPGRIKFGVLPALAVFISIEAAFLSSNLTKIMDGGWFPLVLASAIFTVLSTWRRGVELLQAKAAAQSEARAGKAAAHSRGVRCRAPAYSSAPGVPVIQRFLHNLTHNMVVHEKRYSSPLSSSMRLR